MAAQLFSRRQIILTGGVLLSVACALALVIWRVHMIEKNAIEQFANDPVVDVCVATRAVAPGELLTEDNIAVTKWLTSLLPEGAMTNLDECLGQTAQVALTKNSVLTSDAVQGARQALKVPDGMCAISVPISVTRAVGGAVHAHAFIDLYALENGSASLAAEQVLVLRTSADAQDGVVSDQARTRPQTRDQRLTWLTLAVKLEDAEFLIACASTDSLYATLPGKRIERVPIAGESDSPQQRQDGAQDSETGGSADVRNLRSLRNVEPDDMPVAVEGEDADGSDADAADYDAGDAS